MRWLVLLRWEFRGEHKTGFVIHAQDQREAESMPAFIEDLKASGPFSPVVRATDGPFKLLPS